MSSRTPVPAPDVPCLYEVVIRHARHAPAQHSFCHRSYMWLFDVDHPPRLPGVLRPLGRYRPSDHVDVREVLRREGMEADRILALTNLRVLGYVFNPLTTYWCFDSTGGLRAHVAEVHNTYGDRHAYVLPVQPGPAGTGAVSVVPKQMYVSPFNPVDGDYRIRIGSPGATVSESIELDRHDGAPFRATLAGRRREPETAALLRSFLRYPTAPLRGRALIQLEGLRLWRKHLEVHPR